MTPNDLSRAALVMFAVEHAGPKACVEEMKAIAYCIRNRVRAGWCDGDWLKVMAAAPEHAAHAEPKRIAVDINSRAVQRFMHDIDSIYYGDMHGDDGTAEASEDLEEAVGEAKFWAYLNRPMLEEFRRNIASDKENHPSRAQMSLMMFFE